MFIITRDGRKSRKNIHQEGEEMRSGFYGFLTDDVHAPHFSLSAYAIPCAPGKRRGQTKVFPLLLIPLLFLAAVRRFLSESDTDIGFLPGYDGVDVCLLCTVGKWGDAEDLVRLPLIRHGFAALYQKRSSFRMTFFRLLTPWGLPYRAQPCLRQPWLPLRPSWQQRPDEPSRPVPSSWH